MFLCITLQSRLVCGESFLCTERKNITIIPHIDIEQKWKGDKWIEKHFKNPTMQLRYFIKSLLETSCFEVWFYSTIRNRCIRQTEENYVPFLETEWMAITSTDDNDILNLLSNISHTNDEIEQKLLFLSFERFEKEKKRKDASTFVQRIKQIRHKYNIIVLCTARFSKLCQGGRKWLPDQNLIFGDFYDISFNPHIHRILIDLANNPRYDWRERYIRESSQCQITKKTNIFAWHVFDPFQNKRLRALFLLDVLNESLNNITMYKGGKLTVEQSSISFKNPYYIMPYKDWNRVHYISELKKNTTQLTKSVQDIGGDFQIHIIFYYKELEPYSNEPPFTFNNTIRIIVDETIPESPMINKDGHLVTWKDDFFNPSLMNMLIDKTNSILC